MLGTKIIIEFGVELKTQEETCANGEYDTIPNNPIFRAKMTLQAVDVNIDVAGFMPYGLNPACLGSATKIKLCVLRAALFEIKDKVDPYLAEYGLTFNDALNAVAVLNEDDFKKLKSKEIVEKLLNAAGALAVKVALFKFRVPLQPHLVENGLTWEDAMTMVSSIKLADLKQSIDARDPSGLLQKILTACIPLAKKAALFKIRAPLEPKLKEYGITWKDATSAAQDSITFDDLKKVINTGDMTTVLNKILSATIELGKKAALFQLKSALEPALNGTGLEWEGVEEVCNKHIVFDDIKDAIKKLPAPPQNLAKKILNAAGEFAMTMALVKARPFLEPSLAANGLTWDDVAELADFVTLNDLTRGITNPEGLLERFMEISGPLAKKIVLYNLKNITEPLLKTIGLSLEDKMPKLPSLPPPLDDTEAAVEDAGKTIGEMIIETITLDDLWKALNTQKAGPIIDKLLDASADLAKQVALNMARKVLEPKLEEQGLVWEDAKSVIYLIEIADLKSGNPTKISDKILNVSTTLAKKVFLFKIKPTIEPKLLANGLTYEDAVSVVYLITIGTGLELRVRWEVLRSPHSAPKDSHVLQH